MDYLIAFTVAIVLMWILLTYAEKSVYGSRNVVTWAEWVVILVIKTPFRLAWFLLAVVAQKIKQRA
jgi:hypothetical protein